MQKSIIKSGQVRVGFDLTVAEMSSAAARSSSSSAAPGGEPIAACGEKRVELLRIDGRVEGIELTCGCGEVTVVRLEYGEANEPNEPAS